MRCPEVLQFEDDFLKRRRFHSIFAVRYLDLLSEGIITDGKMKEERKDDKHLNAIYRPICASRVPSPQLRTSGEAGSVSSGIYLRLCPTSIAKPIEKNVVVGGHSPL